MSSNPNATKNSLLEIVCPGGLEDGELNSEEEETAAKATNGRKLSADRNLNMRTFGNDDIRGGSHRFRHATMRHQSGDVREDYIDEYEMINIRGGSPPTIRERNEKNISPNKNNSNSASNYSESDEGFGAGRVSRRSNRRRKDRTRHRRRSRRSHQYKDKLDARESRGGQTSKNNSSTPNAEKHQTEDTNENRKLETCKFYLTGCCTKSNTCDYMHADFPCKYFYLGLECKNEKPCKYLHGKALNPDMKSALIRHITSAPRSILGNFVRMPQDKLESMLEARNNELLMQESGTSIQTIEEKGSGFNNQTTIEETLNKVFQNPLETGLNENIKRIPEVFTETQLISVVKLGIKCIEEIKHLSLAKLSEIGLNVIQINEIQQMFEKVYNTQQQNGKDVVTTENSQNDFKKVSMVAKQIRKLNSDESEEERQHFDVKEDRESDQSILDILNSLDDAMNSSSDLQEDGSKLVIHESCVSENDYESEQSVRNAKDCRRAQNESDFVDNTKNRELVASCSQTGLGYFEQMDLYIKSRGDHDMRHLPVHDFIPDFEIQASISSHPPIKYKLIEIYIPKIQQSNIPLNYNNLLDPRLKRELQLQNYNSSEDNPCMSSNSATNSLQKSQSSSNTSIGLCGNLSCDPRKRKEVENTSTQLSIPNFQLIFNGYLQNSKWYQDQNSNVKIQVNHLLSRLSSELTRFHQNSNGHANFEMRNIEWTDNIDEILINLGIQIDAHGNVCARATETNPSKESDNSGIPPIFHLNVSNGPINFHGYPSPDNIPPFSLGNLLPPRLPTPCWDIQKPGLLGFAPGFHYPPPPPPHFFPVQPPNPAFITFQPQVTEHHHPWQNCLPRPPFHYPPPLMGLPPYAQAIIPQQSINENINQNQNRKRGTPFERRGNFKRWKRN